MGYSRDEMETTCSYDYLNKMWTVYTTVPTHITRLLKLAEPEWKEEEPGKYGKPRIIAGKWKLNRNQVRFAKLLERKEVERQEDEDEQEESA